MRKGFTECCGVYHHCTDTTLLSHQRPIVDDGGLVFGERFSDIETLTWGTIDQGGTFTAGTAAGQFPNTIRISLQAGAGSIEATASVMVKPGPVNRATISPAQANLDIGATQDFTAQVSDQFGNLIANAIIAWKVSTDARTIDTRGRFTAGTKQASSATL